MKNKLNGFAIFVTDKVGTVGFFLTVLVWTLCWLTWNTFAPKALRFDPYPAFVLWLFISNMIQILLMPLILLGQNVQTKKMESIIHKDYNVDKQVLMELKDIKEQLKQTKK